jgi:SAM-dependent methyltransferase
VLKTDLFEEANGADHILGDLAREARRAVGIDLVTSTVTRAARRFPSRPFQACVSDLRCFAFRDESFDLIVSTSTLDHFEGREDFELALGELVRVLRPGGRIVLVLDNPLNPLYVVLKCFCRWFGPFALGYSPTRRRVQRQLERMGLEVLGGDYVIHNPRLVSTAMFWSARKLFGTQAEGAIQALLWFFGLFDKLPTRRFTGCFSVLGVEKRAAVPPVRAASRAGQGSLTKTVKAPRGSAVG